MKVNLSTSAVDSNIDSTELKFEVVSSAKIVHLLTKNLYSQPWQSCVRELISNALDAHVDAKMEAPVEIEFESISKDDSGYLLIRDYGLGMSPQTVSEVLTKLGVTSKDKDNAQHGGFGIGLLSVFAVADVSTLITTIDGVTYVYALYVSEEGIPAMSLVSSEASSAPSGTSIQVPIASMSEQEMVVNALANICPYLDRPPLLTDKTKNSLILDLDKRIEFKIWQMKENVVAMQGKSWKFWALKENLNFSSMCIVLRVGQVQYSIPNFKNILKRLKDANTIQDFDFTTNFRSSATSILAIDIPIGMLEFPSSREEVSDTTSNNDIIYKYLSEAMIDCKDEIPYYLQHDSKGACLPIRFKLALYRKLGLKGDLYEQGYYIPIKSFYLNLSNVKANRYISKENGYGKVEFVNRQVFELVELNRESVSGLPQVYIYIGASRQASFYVNKEYPGATTKRPCYILCFDGQGNWDNLVYAYPVLKLLSNAPVVKPPKRVVKPDSLVKAVDKWIKRPTGLKIAPSILDKLDLDNLEQATKLPCSSNPGYYLELTKCEQENHLKMHKDMLEMFGLDPCVYFLTRQGVKQMEHLEISNRFVPLSDAFDKELAKTYLDNKGLIRRLGCIPGAEGVFKASKDYSSSYWEVQKTWLARLSSGLVKIANAPGAKELLGEQQYADCLSTAALLHKLGLGMRFSYTLKLTLTQAAIKEICSQYPEVDHISDTDLKYTLNSLCKELFKVLPHLKESVVFTDPFGYNFEHRLSVLLNDFPLLLQYKQLQNATAE